MLNFSLFNRVIETHSLRPNQERYLLAERGSNYSFFIGIWTILPGRLDSSRLRTAIIRALARHPAFRTIFPRSVDGTYRADVLSRADVSFERRAIPDLEAATVEIAAAPLMRKLTGFERLRDLHRVLLLDAPDGRQALVFAQHHSVSDGRSLDLLLSEVSLLYSGQEDLPLPASYYEIASPDDANNDDKSFWKKVLGDVDVVPQMHRALRDRTDVCPARIGRAMDTETSALLSGLPKGRTAFSMLAGGFAAQIARQTGLRTVVFSIQSAGRHGLGDTRVLGPLSNAVPICIDVDFSETAAALASRLHTKIRESLRHESFGYHLIQQATTVRPDFALNLYPDAEPLAFEHLIPGTRRFLTSESDYGVNLRWQREADGRFTADIYHDAAVIEPSRAEAFLDRAVAITKSIVHHPDRTIAESLEISRITPAPATVRKFEDTPRRLAEIFADCVQKHGSRTAIRYGGRSITYSELLQSVEDLAGRFYSAGLTEGMTIAFEANRTPAFVETILACSRLGASFCALDSTYPPERLRQQAELLAPQAVFLPDDGKTAISDALSSSGLKILRLDRSKDSLPAPVPAPPVPDEVAYYLFTSGTTGVPNLVGTRHAALPAFLQWQTATFNIIPGEITSLLSGLAHDPVLRDVFLPLTTGGTLTIPSADILRDPRSLTQWLEAERPNIIHITPPLGRLLWQTGDTGPRLPGTRLVLWGGDMLTGELIAAAAEANPGLVQVNAYGATETPQVVLWHRCRTEDEQLRAVPVGCPRDYIGVRINTADGGQGDVNETGEIVIEMPDHVVRKNGNGKSHEIGNAYNTGDLGYLRPDSTIQVIGRADDQVSIRGYRVELSEVSSVLSKQDGVRESVVLVDSDNSGAPTLIGHVVVAEGHKLDAVTLRRRLAVVLPPYMVPAQLMIHDAMPLLPNGKIDRSTLRSRSNAAKTDHAAQTDTSTSLAASGEAVVATIFSEVLGRPVTDRNMSFIDLGADSLNAIQAMLRLERILPDLPEEWPDMSIADLAIMTQTNETEISAPQTFGLHNMLTLVRTELTVIFRALAILAVVALHYRVGSVGGGATIILFLLMGYSIARFQLPQVLTKATAQPILAPLIRIVAITVPVVLAILIAKAISGEPLQIAGLLFLSNFIDFSDPVASAGGTVWLWFIAAYVQILLIIAAVVMLPWVRTALATWPGKSLIAAFLLATVIKYSILGLADFSLLTGGVPPLTHWNYLPTTHLPTVILGMLVFMARIGRVDRTFCSILIAIYALSVGMVFANNRPEIFLIVALSVLWIGNIRTPRVFYLIVSAISHSSLYLYLFHPPLSSILQLLGIRFTPLLELVFAVVFSIAFTRFWEQFLRYVDLRWLQKTGQDEVRAEAERS